MVTIEELIGKTFASVEKIANDELVFTTVEGDQYTLYHAQDCCERVYIESIVGDLSDLVGTPLLRAEEATSEVNPEGVRIEDQDSFTWTFYKFATAKGYVDVRWYGESNGYYSESVHFEKIPGVGGLI